ncbi:CvfB family protein [Helicobacter cholecystus]|uniref:CvfB family protein n=1 Tax=Helicobacter cholecystus TaxID=45498 RepID=UPI002739AAF6|nr:S1-like domain-containing RNA-binding protein [Helicobacter cholecystus]
MVGSYVNLEVRKILPFGAILGEKEILLPKKYMPQDCQIGDTLEVFVYTDSEDRIIATTLKPYGVLDEIVALEIVDIVNNGVYLDLGIAKDIFMPHQFPYSLKRGEKRVVKIQKDKEGRLIANPILKFTPCRDKSKLRTKSFAKVYRKTPLGFECVVEEKYQGMLYDNELFSVLSIAQEVEVVIKNIRPDGKLDLKLVQEDEVQSLLKTLRANANTLKLTKDSDPQEIYKIAKMSKKAFKRALVKLADRINQSQEGITLLR